MKTRHLFLLILLFNWSATSSAGSFRYSSNNFSISDFDSVSEAVDSIKTILQEQGMKIVGVIDHAANAKKVGLELADTQLILFRDHRLERKLIGRNSTAAIDLPIKFMVFKDSKTGEIKLIYNPAGYLTDRHNLKSSDYSLLKMNKRLKQFGLLDNGLITIESQHSVEETTENLKQVLQNNGFSIPFTFNFLKSNTSRKNSQLIIFGNPEIGTKLMQNQQQAGLDLPLKFLVWKDDTSGVHVTYNDPLFIGKRHGLQGLNTLLGNISNRLGILANIAAGNE